MSTARLFVDTVQVGPSLQLRRLPQFLRFTRKGELLDALDQSDDEPRPDETLVAAVLVSTDSVHIDRVVNGRRFGDWHKEARYEMVNPQPPDDVMRDRDKWESWCIEQQQKGAGKCG